MFDSRLKVAQIQNELEKYKCRDLSPENQMP